ncbi:hypothetical protein APHAL10511_002841 [Amanita phalloides]|nr:hypothetical protein APHAL10511_002841 [Amanita phalloides]
MSDKDDELLVPPEPTEIRIIDDKDKDDIVVAFCKKVHEETKPKPGHEKQQWEPYKRCCVEENLWNYGSGLELVKVPVSTYYVKTH